MEEKNKHSKVAAVENDFFIKDKSIKISWRSNLWPRLWWLWNNCACKIIPAFNVFSREDAISHNVTHFFLVWPRCKIYVCVVLRSELRTLCLLGGWALYNLSHISCPISMLFDIMKASESQFNKIPVLMVLFSESNAKLITRETP